MTTEFEREADKSTDDIRSDIFRTRAAMDRTLDQLGRVLHPRHLSEEFFGLFTGRNRETRKSLMDAGNSFIQGIANRPVSTMIIASGLVALIIEQRRGTGREPADYTYTRWSGEPFGPGPYYQEGAEYEQGALGEEAGSKAQDVMESAKGGVQQAKEKVSELGESAKQSAMRGKAKLTGSFRRAGDYAGSMSDKAASYRKKVSREARETYDEGLQRIQQTAEEYPLAIGAASFAVGLLCGIGLPISRKEAELMEPLSKEVKTAARETMEELKEKGGQVADETAHTAVEEAKSQAEEIKHEQHH